MNFSNLKEFKYGWRVVLSSALGIGLGMSPLPFYTIGVFAIALTTEFGWGMDDVLLALPVFTTVSMFLGPVAGNIADRFGVRKTVLTSVILFSLAFMAFTFNTGSKALWLILWGILAATGVGTLPITWTRAVNNWFTKNRGLALGITLMGTGIFGALAKLYASELINTYGWEVAYIGVGVLPLIIVLPLAYAYFRDVDDPKVADRVARLKEEFPESGASAARTGMTLKQALADSKFWLMALAFVTVSFAVGGPIPNLEKLFTSKGFGIDDAVLLASLLGVAVVIGRVVGGYLIDRFWAPGVSFVLLCLPAISCYLLIQPELTYSMAATAIVILGFATGVEFDLIGFLVSKYFGMKYYSSIYGVIYSFFGFGAGFAPYIFSRFYTQTGSYDSILFYCIFAFILGAAPLLLLGKYRTFTEDGEVITA